jgi:hypothetical protein
MNIRYRIIFSLYNDTYEYIGLPEGWSEVYDRTSGEKYYWNEVY